MTVFGLILITLGLIVGAQWLWVLGIVITGIAVVSALRGVHTRIVPGRAHYI